MHLIPYRILIAEDEPPSMRTLERMLGRISERLPIRICGKARNGQEAMTQCTASRPHIILSDIRMPQSDGLRLAEHIRSAYPDTLIAFITAHQEFSYAKRALQLGLHDYLLKPLKEQELADMLTRMVSMLNARYQDQLLNHVRAGLAGNVFEHAPDKRYEIYCAMLISAGPFCDEPAIPTSAIASCQAISEALTSIVPHDALLVVPAGNTNRLSAVLCLDSTPISLPSALYGAICALPTKASITCIYQMVDTPEVLANTFVQLSSALAERQVPGESQVLDASIPFRPPPIPQLTAEQEHLLCSLLHAKQHALFAERLSQAMHEAVSPQKTTQRQLMRLMRDVLALIKTQAEGLQREDQHMLDDIPQSCMVVDYASDRIIHSFCHKIKCFFSDRRKPYPEDAPMHAVIQRITQFIAEHFKQPLELSTIASEHGISYAYMSTLYKRYNGISPSRHILSLRIACAKAQIAQEPGISFKSVALSLGYEDSHYFSRLFRSETGLSPSEYRNSLLSGKE